LSEKDTVVPMGHERQLAQLLEGIAGVYIRYEGGSIEVLVRGGHPLFVVDHMPLGYSYASVNNLVNVHDVDHIEVLKNMSETALYGYRARHGVIHIHTKRGGQ
jgi:TonB-dependent SusC/RagA subfamily outer membrane receptor